MRIVDYNKIDDIIKSEGLEIVVISYGGCGSNQLVDILEENGLKVKTDIWHKILCHSPYPLENHKMIYIYRNPIHAFLSMKRRGQGFYDVNQRKLSNNNNKKLSDETLLKLMILQFYRFINYKRENLLIINYEEIFKDDIKLKLENFIGKKLKNLPIEKKKTNLEINKKIINTEYLEYHFKYDIDFINKYS